WVDGFGYEQDGQYKLDNVKLFYYSAAGDTLINGKNYFRIQRKRISKTHCELDVDDYSYETEEDTLCFFMREDEVGDVWFYTEDKNVFYEISHNALYNDYNLADDLICRDLFLFNVKKKYAIGETLPLGVIALDSPNGFREGQDYWDIYPYEVKSIDEMSLLDGKTYKLYNDYILEGIGPLNGPLIGIGTPNSYALDFNQLFAFYREGQLIYRNEGYLSALEEHFPNILDIVTGKHQNDPVTYTKDQMATIILPTTPDASKGKYYRLDRWEDDHLVFEEESHPQARTPYIIVPNEDFNIDPSTFDMTGLYYDTVRIEAVSLLDPPRMVEVRFVGTYARRDIGFKDNGMIFYILDTTSDCIYKPNGKSSIIMGALRAHFEVSHYLCFEYEEGKCWSELKYVLHDTSTSLNSIQQAGDSFQGGEIVNGKLSNRTLFDLQGRRLSGKPARGIYIENGKKVLY
nr:hypothetical protein [Bacteroidaceae bacterium]